MDFLSSTRKAPLFYGCTSTVIIVVTITVTSARSLTKMTDDTIQNGVSNEVIKTSPIANSTSSTHSRRNGKKGQHHLDEIDEMSRTKRQAPNDCHVRKHLPVIVEGQGLETYPGFDEDDPRPALFPGETIFLSCPAPSGSWWPAVEKHLSGICPYKKVTLDMNNNPFGYEVYPRYITAAECICRNCISANAFGCQEIRRKFTVYWKKECQGTIPILRSSQVAITVGCFCQGARTI